MESKFITALDTRDIDDENFFLLSDLIYQSKILNGTIIVPKGFKSDGSSTPRVPIIYTLYGGRAHHEGVVHDYFYRCPGHTVSICDEKYNRKYDKIIEKPMADKIFYEAMTARNKPFHVKWGMYSGVKIGGFSSWKTGQSRYEIIKF